MTQDDQFRQASKLFCKDEMVANPDLARCAEAMEPGHALSCFIDFILNLPKESRCFQFLGKFDLFSTDLEGANFFIPI